MAKEEKPLTLNQTRQAPFIGEIVHWYPHGQRNQPPQAAIVTAIGMNSLTLNIYSPKNYNTTIRDGVRHVDQRETPETQFKESGGWDWTPAYHEQNTIKSMILSLAGRLALMDQKNNKPQSQQGQVPTPQNQEVPSPVAGRS